MQSLGRTALSSARKTRARLPRQSRRYAHDGGHHSAEASESFGPKFYIGLTTVPALYLLYSLSRETDTRKPFFTSVLEKYSDLQDTWRERNDRHTTLVEEAAAQRQLFYGSKGNTEVPLKFPELLNTGAPWNVPAGQTANIEKTIAKYEKEHFEENERKLKALKDGTLKPKQQW